MRFPAALLCLFLFFSRSGEASPLDANNDAATNLAAGATRPEQTASTSSGEGEVVPGQSFEGIRRIPKSTRIFYGSVAIGGLLLLAVVMRLFKRKAT